MGKGRVYSEYTQPKPIPVGIYGWRKRCLYAFILFLMVVVIMNMALSVWILRVLDFSIDGMGKLRVTKKGIRLEGEAEFLENIYVSKINSKRGEPLFVESSRNITFHARNSQGRVTNKFVIGDRKIESYGEKFEIRDKSGIVIFRVNSKDVKLGMDEVIYTGKVEFQGSITTPNIRSPLNKPLNIESLSSEIKISGEQGVSLVSNSGDIEIQSMDDVKIQSEEQNIVLDSKEIFIKNLTISEPTGAGASYYGVHQLCMCAGGRLFIAPPDGDCQASNEICA